MLVVERPELSNTTKIILLVEFLFVAYMLYVLTSSIYQSYQIDRHIAEFEAENKRIAEENLNLSDDYKYYTSSEYQEKIGKLNGLINPGEEVIILPEEDAVTFDDEEETSTQNLKRWNRYSMPEKWWRFFFEN